VSEELYSGPSVLAPGAPKRPDALARWIVWPLLLTLLAATIVFYVLFSPLRVVGDSMLPTLLSGDRVLRTKSYKQPSRGDVVIIDASTESDKDDVIKRVVAVQGDVVEIRDDVAIVNGVREATAGVLTGAPQDPYAIGAITVPPGHVYVLGDNRPVSLDSRYLGPVPLDHVRGEARFIFLPLSRFGAVR
jgi:signal peptidase I